MIFVTTGSQKFQFDRLIKKIDDLVADGIITDTVFAQIGYGTYKPRHFDYCDFMNRDEFAEKMKECTTVLTHGGTGVIIGAVKQGKKVIAVPRLAKFGEHVDDHQVQLLNEFDGMNIITACYDIDDLGKCIKESENKSFATYESNTHRIIDDIETYLQLK